MNRNTFIKSLITGVAVSPMLIAEKLTSTPTNTNEMYTDFLPIGNKTGYKIELVEFTANDIQINLDKKLIHVTKRIPLIAVYHRYMDVLYTPQGMSEMTGMIALTSNLFKLENGWDFTEISKDRLFDGSWFYGYKDECYTNTYGVGALNDNDLPYFKCKYSINDSPIWKNLGNGIRYIDDENKSVIDYHIFNKNIKFRRNDLCKITANLLDSNNNVLSTYSHTMTGIYSSVFALHASLPTLTINGEIV